ncbi:hypothetical protein, partial [Chitinophaga sp. YIM B06452]|uniref:hypothetical protein n=1 Tax=Chitinophaga sp. YIM B06452 TaxID=3082158 RepID=UPI0031FEC5E3
MRQIITVQDTTRPTFTVAPPANVLVNCDAIPPVPPLLTATDNCSAALVTVSFNERRESAPGACINNYRLFRVWTARDACGNVD